MVEHNGAWAVGKKELEIQGSHGEDAILEDRSNLKTDEVR